MINEFFSTIADDINSINHINDNDNDPIMLMCILFMIMSFCLSFIIYSTIMVYYNSFMY